MAVLKQLILAVVLVTLEISFASSDDKTCGEKSCKEYEYCSDLICNNCSQICRKESHNYEHSTCQANCQDYINDFVLGFVRRSEIQDLINTAIFKQYVLVLISLTLSILIIITIVSILLYVWVQYRRRKIVDTDKTIKKMQTVHAICNNNSAIDGVNNVNRLHLKMPSPTIDHKDTPSEVTTTTPLSTRHPAEDATLEYAYDNPALTHSPISFKEPSPRPRTETSF